MEDWTFLSRLMGRGHGSDTHCGYRSDCGLAVGRVISFVKVKTENMLAAALPNLWGRAVTIHWEGSLRLKILRKSRATKHQRQGIIPV